MASDRITVDGKPVGFMYREAPRDAIDSGWHFLSGEEAQEYTDDPGNFAIYDVNTIANYDPAIISHLDAPIGSAFGRGESGELVPEEMPVTRMPSTSLKRAHGRQDGEIVQQRVRR